MWAYQSLRAFTMKTLIFGNLSGSHIYTSLIYNFLIGVSNKHSILDLTQNS